jgi:hypothetical protein
MSKGIESASGLAAHREVGTYVDQSEPEHSTQVFTKDRGTVTVDVVRSGPGAGDSTPTMPRKRDYVWPEVHDPFDSQTAEVDERSSGDPVGEPDRHQWRLVT